MTKRTDISRRLRTLSVLVSTLALGAMTLTMSGCGEEPPPPPPPPPPAPPPPPPPPALTPIEQLMSQLNIDERIRLPEDKAPGSDPERVAVLTFFDTFARGDSSKVQPMLSGPDQFELEKLVTSGQWEVTTAKVTRIDVRAGKSPDGQPSVLAVMHVGDRFEPQLWIYKLNGANAEFEAVATPPGILDSLSGENWIEAWYAVLAKEIELASKPDESPALPQSDFTPADDSSAEESSDGPSMKPGGGGRTNKRKPTENPIRAPKPGFN